jgi:hypothetical protein
MKGAVSMAIPLGNYHKLMMKIFDLTKNGEREVSLSEIREKSTYFNELDNNKKYAGTKQLSHALCWLKNNELLAMKRKDKRNFYRPTMRRYEYIEQLLRELNLEYLIA